jgi:hypothetical protein
VKNLNCWLAVLIAGIVAVVLDWAVQAKWLASAYYSRIESMRVDAKPINFIIGDFVAVAVLAWVLTRLSSSFGSGARGGANAGFYLGVLVSFPAYHFIFLTFKGYPYSLTWINTIYGVIWYMIIGAILGAVMRRPLIGETGA